MHTSDMLNSRPVAKVEIATKSDAISVQLPRVSDLVTAGPLHQMLTAALNEGGELKVDASQVERVSTACLQLLLATRKCLEAGGGRMSLLAPSEAILSALGDLGLRDMLLGGEGADA